MPKQIYYLHKVILKGLLFVSVLGFNCFSQSINRIEYFIDTDPGFGNATSVAFSPNDTVANLNFLANTAGFSSGLHTLFVRSKDNNNAWSLTKSIAFVKSGLSVPTQNIVQIEYYIDSDPGFGGGTQVGFTPSTNISNLTFVANTTGINSGLHTIFVRSKDANGLWSLTNKHSFVKSNLSTPSINIVKAEYFIDVDPGFGSAINIPLTPASNISSLTFNANVDTIKSGLHNLYVRTMDVNGQWSITNRHSFVRMANTNILGNIIEAEYYIDTDPGIGNAINIPISSPNANLSLFTFSADVLNVNNGLHTIYVRTKDANGVWSLTNRHSFYKDQTITNENIVAVEYFVDTDPGVGNATTVVLSASPVINSQSFVANLNSYSVGAHTLYVRSKNQNGDWSLTNRVDFNKAFVAPVANFSAPTTTGCAPFTVNFTDASQNSPTTWAWDFDNNGTTDATTQNPSYTFNTPGTYSVKLTVGNVSGNNTIIRTSYVTVISNYNTNNSASICSGDSIYLQGQFRKTAGIYLDTLSSVNGCDSIIHTTLSISPLITPNISINSNYTTACDNDLINFTSNIANGGTSPIYQWQVNGINISGNSSSISLSTLNDNDIVSCILTSNVSCPSKIKDTSNFIIADILPTSTNSFSATSCVSYTLNSITYTASGVYTQTLSNSVGCDSIITLNLTIKNNSTITKNYSICIGDTVYEGLNAYYQTGIFDNYYMAVNGCDSIVTINLQVIDIDTSIYLSSGSIFSNQISATYQWLDCSTGLAISGATNYFYTPTANGSYAVIINLGSCSDTSACININSIGMVDITTDEDLKIYPNPSKGKITIEFPNINCSKLNLVDVLGKTIFSQQLNNSQKEVSLDLSVFENGIYFIQLETSNGTLVKKVIKEN